MAGAGYIDLGGVQNLTEGAIQENEMIGYDPAIYNEQIANSDMTDEEKAEAIRINTIKWDRQTGGETDPVMGPDFEEGFDLRNWQNDFANAPHDVKLNMLVNWFGYAPAQAQKYLDNLPVITEKYTTEMRGFQDGWDEFSAWAIQNGIDFTKRIDDITKASTKEYSALAAATDALNASATADYQSLNRRMAALGSKYDEDVGKLKGVNLRGLGMTGSVRLEPVEQKRAAREKYLAMLTGADSQKSALDSQYGLSRSLGQDKYAALADKYNSEYGGAEMIGDMLTNTGLQRQAALNNSRDIANNIFAAEMGLNQSNLLPMELLTQMINAKNNQYAIDAQTSASSNRPQWWENLAPALIEAGVDIAAPMLGLGNAAARTNPYDSGTG